MWYFFFPNKVAQKSTEWKKFSLQWDTIEQKKISIIKTQTT